MDKTCSERRTSTEDDPRSITLMTSGNDDNDTDNVRDSVRITLLTQLKLRIINYIPLLITENNIMTPNLR